MSVAIQAQWKKDTRTYNGIESIVDQLLENPTLRHVVAGVIEVVDITEHVNDGGSKTVKVNFVQIEPLAGEVAVDVRRALEHAFKLRTDGALQDDLFSDTGGED